MGEDCIELSNDLMQSNLNTERLLSKQVGLPDDKQYMMNQNFINSATQSARESAHASSNNCPMLRKRSSKRGNKNVNQKECRQRQVPD